MSYVTQRPLNIATPDNLVDGKMKIKYNFKTKLINPTIKVFDDSDIFLKGIMISNFPKNEKVLNYNGKDYILNYLAISKSADFIEYDAVAAVNEYCIAMVLTDIHYIEKLCILHPISEGIGGLNENSTILNKIITKCKDAIISQTVPSETTIDNFSYNLNNFIPLKPHYYYHFRTPNKFIVSFIIIKPGDSTFYHQEFSDIASILDDTSPYTEHTSTEGTIYYMDTLPEQIETADDSEQEYDNDKIYIDCQPISDTENKVNANIKFFLSFK